MPCGNEKNYSDCCGIYISGEKSAPSPETLMRSRYTAYAQKNIDYIAKTMKSPAKDKFDIKSATEWANKIKLTKLEVIKATENNNKGFVEFRAHYDENNEKRIMHELSEFSYEEGKWYYLNNLPRKLGRNDPCPCGSNKKYKKCCNFFKVNKNVT